MFSFNDLFGVNLKNLPNAKSTYVKSTYNTSGDEVKEYTHRIKEDTEHFFRNVTIYVIGKNATNFIFETIPYERSKANDIAFLIERDFFNNGNLKYTDFLSSSKARELNGSYFTVYWEIEGVMLELSRMDEELTFKAWTHFYNEAFETPTDLTSIIAKDGIKEYSFGTDNYPQGYEDTDNNPKMKIEGYSSRTIEVRMAVTDDLLKVVKQLIYMKASDTVNFMGVLIDDIPVFLETKTRSILPVTQFVDRKNIRDGYQVFASIVDIDVDNLDKFVGFTFTILNTDSIAENGAIKMSSDVVYNIVPDYAKDIFNHYSLNNDDANSVDSDKLEAEANFQNKNISVVIPSSDENLANIKTMIIGKMRDKEYMFVAQLQNGTPMFVCDELQGMNIPISDAEMSKYVYEGRNIIASVSKIDTDHLDKYISLEMLVVY